MTDQVDGAGRAAAADLSHRTARMFGRDIGEPHRGATPLELLFDLTFVIAFGVAADELAHALAEDHIGSGMVGFAFAGFAVSWAWINFSWFASAYDTDDWLYRLTTMVQMVGVLILALGLPDMFASLEEGEVLDNRVMVLGYVVMRVPMVFQWLRAAREDPARRAAAMTYVTSIVVSQAGWCLLLLPETAIPVTFAIGGGLILIELAGPVVAETRKGGTPWHPHHIAERYGLLVIIALGEGMIGTTAAMTALVGPGGPGWSLDFVLVGLAGVALVFGMWWTYFVVPCGDLLAAHRERSFGWGYGHVPLFGAVVGVGAGLHVAAYYLEHHTDLGTFGTVVAVAVPTAIYLVGLYLLYAQLTRSYDPFHLVLVAITAVVIAASVLMARAGASMPWSLVVLSLAPWVTVVGYELRGHRHNEEVLAAAR
jgi:low temperature requirement protein LtrA